MKNFCIVSFCNIYVLPYGKTYIDKILKSGNSCTLLFWDRDAVNGNNDSFEGCEKIVYQKKIKSNSGKFVKLIGYCGAASFFRKILFKRDFDGVVFLQTQSAVFTNKILLRKYHHKYIVDIRDYTLERFGWYRRMEIALIQNSFKVVISSPAYKKFLPNGNYIVAHNYSPFPKEVVSRVINNITIEPIKISFIGTIRFLDMDKKILNVFKNDFRFQINYYGTGSEVLKNYCKANRIKNVDFYGSFSPSDTADFYMKTDIINNLYGNNTPFLDYALSNKLYHSGQFLKPILVCPNTYMEEVSLKYKMGFVFDINNPNKDLLFEWFNTYDKIEFKQGCEAFIEAVKKENEEFYNMIDSFIEDN